MNRQPISIVLNPTLWISAENGHVCINGPKVIPDSVDHLRMLIGTLELILKIRERES